MKRILAIDYGDKNIGFAISDSSFKISLPLKIYRRKSLKDDIDFIANLVKERNVKEIVIGNPLNSKGEEGFMSRKVKAFKDALESVLNVPIILWDERFSTKEAEQYLRAYGFNEKKMKNKKDSISASIILQSYLETLNEKK